MQVIVEGLRAEGHEDVWLVSINQAAAESYLDLYLAPLDGPVLQDPAGDPVQTQLGATTYQLWLVDARGRIRYRHGSSNLPDDEALFTGELRGLAQER